MIQPALRRLSDKQTMMICMPIRVRGFKMDTLITSLRKIYWNIGFEPAAYDTLLTWWRDEVRGKPVHLYIGQAAYKINNNAVEAWSDPDEYPRQIALNHQFPEVQGSMHFSLKDLNRNPLGIKDKLQNDIYKHPRLFQQCLGLIIRHPKSTKIKKCGPSYKRSSI